MRRCTLLFPCFATETELGQMKLIIQIPCYNEEQTLPSVVKDLPRSIPGIDVIEYLVVDDGSTDRTVDVARELGVHHVLQLRSNRGLAHAFRAGIETCLQLQADVIVNTDGDNQYDGRDIPRLVEPILQGVAEIVVGTRPIGSIEHFSSLKRTLQRAGSWFVRKLSNTDVQDAPSGFRAFSRDALMRLNLVSDYTYTLESIIQAGRMRIPIISVPIRTNQKLRESRLMKSVASYLVYSLNTMLRVWMSYSAMRVFISTAAVFIILGVALGARFVYFLAVGQGQGHVQSLILAAVLLFVGFQLIVLGLLADLVSTNRKIIESVSYEQRVMRYSRWRSESARADANGSPDG